MHIDRWAELSRMQHLILSTECFAKTLIAGALKRVDKLSKHIQNSFESHTILTRMSVARYVVWMHLFELCDGTVHMHDETDLFRRRTLTAPSLTKPRVSMIPRSNFIAFQRIHASLQLEFILFHRFGHIFSQNCSYSRNECDNSFREIGR